MTVRKVLKSHEKESKIQPLFSRRESSDDEKIYSFYSEITDLLNELKYIVSGI